MKDSFILFLEQEQTVDLLSDEQAGKLFKALYDMVRGEKISFDDKLLNMAFIPIRQSIERNIEKYQKICDRNKLNGSKGGRPPNNPVGSLGSQENPENPDGYSGNPPDPYRVPDPDPCPEPEKQYVGQEPDARKILNKKYKDEAIEIIDWLNEKANRSYRHTKTNLDLVIARLKSGATVQQCCWIITDRCKKWAGTEQEQYLRPATIFGKEKFEGYFGNLPKSIIKNEDESCQSVQSAD